MTLATVLYERKEAVLQQWLDRVLATYPEDAAAAFRREKNQFANPVGHSLRTGTRGILDAVLGDMDGELLRRSLNEMLKIRAVQQFSASQALAFIFDLKKVMRNALGDRLDDPAVGTALEEFERRVDRTILLALDIFVESREQVYQLRVNELKRRMAWVEDRMNRRAPSGRGPAGEVEPPMEVLNVRRGMVR
jgi:hypothetical protein